MAKSACRGADDLNMNKAYVEKPSLWWFGDSAMSETRMWNAPAQAIDLIAYRKSRRETRDDSDTRQDETLRAQRFCATTLKVELMGELADKGINHSEVLREASEATSKTSRRVEHFNTGRLVHAMADHGLATALVHWRPSIKCGEELFVAFTVRRQPRWRGRTKASRLSVCRKSNCGGGDDVSPPWPPRLVYQPSTWPLLVMSVPCVALRRRMMLADALLMEAKQCPVGINFVAANQMRQRPSALVMEL
ncbi:hypothetical protein J3F84DRAFT_297758 [Trichoderma pleuroticola]